MRRARSRGKEIDSAKVQIATKKVGGGAFRSLVALAAPPTGTKPLQQWTVVVRTRRKRLLPMRSACKRSRQTTPNDPTKRKKPLLVLTVCEGSQRCQRLCRRRSRLRKEGWLFEGSVHHSSLRTVASHGGISPHQRHQCTGCCPPKVQKQCDAKGQEWDKRQKIRGDELQAFGKEPFRVVLKTIC